MWKIDSIVVASTTLSVYPNLTVCPFAIARPLRLLLRLLPFLHRYPRNRSSSFRYSGIYFWKSFLIIIL